jgi:hypothetical protein
MTLSSDTKYPSRRAYVVKVRSDATSDALVGRLENLVTGRRYEFTSAADLVRIIGDDIIAPAARARL